jgi:hypothetical protein
MTPYSETQSGLSVVDRLNGVRLSEHDREIAKAYLRKTEAMCDFIWLAGARIRAVFARGATTRTPIETGLTKKVAVAAHLP